MALILADRVQETCNSPGTGTVTLLGAQTGFRSFLAGVGNGNTTYYAIADQVGPNWEVGLGTYSSTGNTLTRTTVFASSNAGALTNFSSGIQNIWVDYPANKAVFQDSTGTVSVPVLLTTSTTSTTPNLSFNASNTGFSVGASVSGSYLQSLLQNKSGTAGASTNYVLSNDLGTDSSYYGEFGMNSSVYSSGTPTDFYSINNGIYFSGHDGDITFGSGNGFKSYFAWGTTGQSAHVINASGALGFSTNLGTTPALSGTTGYGTAGQVPVSAGSAGAVAWSSTPTLTGTNFTGIPISTGISGLGTGIATWLATPSSANLLAAMTDETGTGSLVFATSPSLTTPLLGTPTSGTLTNCTGLPIATGVSGLATGAATFLATPSSANLAALLTDETGTGVNVFATSPTLVTPILGTPQSGNFSTGTFTWPTFNQSTTGNAATATTANALNTANTYQVNVINATGLGPIGQVNMSYGSVSTWYNTGWRNDGGGFYFLQSSAQTTQAGAIAAGFNTLRPFTITLATGAVSIDGTGVGTTFGGSVTATTFSGSWSGIPSGTAMLFAQTAAPTGWTKVITYNDYALRVVNGTAGTGGTVAFTTAFSSKTPAGTISAITPSGSVTVTNAAFTLTTTEMPSHSHSYIGYQVLGGGGLPQNSATATNSYSNGTTSAGSSGSHTHANTATFAGNAVTPTFTGTAINLAVQYVDVIIATKN